MSVYTGDPPYEEACDCEHEAHRHVRGGKCANAGPASWSEEEAMENADKDGWEVQVRELDYGDICADCIKRGHKPAAKAEEATEGDSTK